VYFKEPRYKGYETSRSHIHGKMWTPHFIPNNHHVNHEIVDHYNKLYRQYHHIKVNENPTHIWIISYLLEVIILSGLYFLIL